MQAVSLNKRGRGRKISLGGCVGAAGRKRGNDRMKNRNTADQCGRGKTAGQPERRTAAGPAQRAAFILLVTYICLIYGNSLMPAHISSRESGFLLMKLHDFCEMADLDSGWLTEHIVRKTEIGRASCRERV